MSSSFFRSRRSAPRGFGLDLSPSDVQRMSGITAGAENEAFGTAARDAQRMRERADRDRRFNRQDRAAIDAELANQGIDVDALREELIAEGVPLDQTSASPRELQGLDYRQEDNQVPRDIERSVRKRRMGEDEFGGDAAEDQNFGGFVERGNDRGAAQLEQMAQERLQAQQDPDLMASYDDKRRKQGDYAMPRRGEFYNEEAGGRFNSPRTNQRETPEQYARRIVIEGPKGQALGAMPVAQKAQALQQDISRKVREVYADFGVDSRDINTRRDDLSIDPQGRDMMMQDFGLTQGGNEAIAREFGPETPELMDQGVQSLVTNRKGEPILDSQGRQRRRRGQQFPQTDLETGGVEANGEVYSQ